MPIPVKAQVRPPVIQVPAPPNAVAWGQTYVSIAGGNGQGEEISLTGFTGSSWPGVLMQPGATGLDMPPFNLSSDEAPNLDGSIFRNARATAREFMIPVYLYGIDRRTVNELKRKFYRALNPKRGYCVFKFTEGNGVTRQISAYYKEGMQGAEGEAAGFTWAKYGLQFTAMDPWFYPPRPESTRWDFGEGDPLLSTTASFFPLHITSGVMGGPGVTISNPGDDDAYPVWELHGPIKSFALTSPDGETVKASAPADGTDLVPAGRVLTIDTRPRRKTVKDDLGANYWGRLETNPQFWSVAPGDTKATVSVVTGSGMAAVVLSFYPRYASFV
ncbi:phage tail domain-containing protein [Streptomyces sp. NPDC047525]|uniref:phage tail domain-containing protein n=1 Tax=Streptomyces sp. NPDC047525 TaxID=3155264 RepID=UPI0033DB90D6